MTYSTDVTHTSLYPPTVTLPHDNVVFTRFCRLLCTTVIFQLLKVHFKMLRVFIKLLKVPSVLHPKGHFVKGRAGFEDCRSS